MSTTSLTAFFSALDTALQTVPETGDASLVRRAGVIRSVKDGILLIDGISGVKMGEV